MICVSRRPGEYLWREISLPLLLLLWLENEVVQVEEMQACGSSSCQLLGGLEIWEVEGRNGEEGGRAFPWSPWLSAEQNPSLIKGECRGETWKWHSPPPIPILEMLCMTATATQPAGSPLSPSLSFSLSLPLPRGEYQCFWWMYIHTYTFHWNPSIMDPLQGGRRQQL